MLQLQWERILIALAGVCLEPAGESVEVSRGFRGFLELGGGASLLSWRLPLGFQASVLLELGCSGCLGYQQVQDSVLYSAFYSSCILVLLNVLCLLGTC